MNSNGFEYSIENEPLDFFSESRIQISGFNRIIVEGFGPDGTRYSLRFNIAGLAEPATPLLESVQPGLVKLKQIDLRYAEIKESSLHYKKLTITIPLDGNPVPSPRETIDRDN